MGDIVERLRETQDDWPACLVELEIEAAGEIERLREENARLKEAQKKLEEQFHKVACEEADAQKEIARLWEERDLLNAILTNVALSMEAFDNYADIRDGDAE